MMRKLFPVLLLFCLLLSGCSRDPISRTSDELSPEAVPAPAVADLPLNHDQATLWFRFGDEPLLAAESREIIHSKTETHALALLHALFEGPSAASTELNGLFPQGTQVISVTQSGRVMFVMLSKHIMNGYPDEPASWRDQPRWRVEVPLRRQLAMQSIVATLTENCPVDTVVILVDQTATDSLRLRQSYFTLDGNAVLAAPLIRDESLLLTPARTAEVILQCWQEGDYSRLYRYIAHTDPATGAVRPGLEEIVQIMTAEPKLLQAAVTGGSVTMDGQRAVFTISGAYLTDGTATPFSGMVLHLIREKGLWRVGLSQLTGREAQP